MAALNKMLPRLSKCRGAVRRKQGGYVRLSALLPLLFNQKFRPQDLFRAGEAGCHYEVVSPDSLLQRRNRLNYSSQFSASVWTRGALLSITTKADGVGDLVVPNTTSGNHYISQTTGTQGGVNNALMVRAKAAGFNYIALQLGGSNVWFNLNTGVVGSNPGGFLASIAAVPGLPGYYDCYVAGIGVATTPIIYICPGDGGSSMTPDGVSGVYLARAQVEWNTLTSTAYQDVTDWNTEFLATVGVDNITMWQDAVGTTPVTGVEQPVGRWRDTKRGLVLGPELWTNMAASGAAPITANGTISVAGEEVTCTCTVSGTFGVSFANILPTIANKTYRALLTITQNNNSRTVSCDIGNTTANITSATSPSGARVTTQSPTTVTSPLRVYVGTAQTVGDVFKVTVQSFREIVGAHVIQATAGSRPVLSARYNLLIKSEQFDDSAWTKNNITVTANSTVAPDGTQTADTLAANTVSQAPIYQGITAAATSYKRRICLRAGTVTTAGLTLYDQTAATHRTTTATVINGPGSVVVSAGIANINGLSATAWTCIEITTTTAVIGNALRAYIYITGSGSVNNVGDSIVVWGDDLRTLDDAAKSIPVYQRVNTANDYDTVGFPCYVKFDGVDDSLYTTDTVDFSAVDKMTVWTMATKLSDASTAILAELGTTATAGSMYLATHDTGSGIGHEWTAMTHGTTAANSSQVAYDPTLSPDSAVITALHDIAASRSDLRRNGVTMNPGTGAKGTGNLANATLNIGRRANSTLPYPGRLYSLTLRGTTTPSSEAFIAKMNRYAARLAAVSTV